MIEIDCFRLLADMSASDTLLEQERVEKEKHESEEIAVEVVTTRLHLIRIENDHRLFFLRS